MLSHTEQRNRNIDKLRRSNMPWFDAQENLALAVQGAARHLGKSLKTLLTGLLSVLEDSLLDSLLIFLSSFHGLAEFGSFEGIESVHDGFDLSKLRLDERSGGRLSGGEEVVEGTEKGVSSLLLTLQACITK